ncbi:MAG: hypothetical protein V7637_6019 [Mycobacteriales bacterium]|jgi:hypothetical protein
MSEWDVVTDLLRGRSQRADGPARPVPSPVAAVVLAAFGSALTGLAVLTAVVLVAWITDTRGTASAAAAMRLAADAWLLAQGGRLSIPGGTVDAIPLGLTALPALLLYRAGGALAAGPAGRGLRAAARSIGALALLYGLIAAVVANAAATGPTRVGTLSAAAGAVVLAAAAAGTGVLRAAGLLGAAVAVLPRAVPPVGRAAAVAVTTLLGAGAAVAAISLAVHGTRAMDLTRALDPGQVGGLLLLVVGVLLVPNAAIWAAGWVAGPGFAVGVGTGVSPFGVGLGPVPALPVLAALPGSAPPQAFRLVLLVPLLAGVLAGLTIARRTPTTAPDDGAVDGPGDGPAGGSAGRPAGAGRAWRCAGYGAAAGLLAGGVVAALSVLAGGSVGGGYLTAVGPSPWQFGLAVAVEVGVPATLVAALIPAPRPPAGEPPSGG